MAYGALDDAGSNVSINRELVIRNGESPENNEPGIGLIEKGEGKHVRNTACSAETGDRFIQVRHWTSEKCSELFDTAESSPPLYL